MKRNDRVNGDPLHIGPRGKARSQRKSGRDPGMTPTERTKKDSLMKQFCKNTATVSCGASPEYRRNYDKIDWSR